MDRTVRLHRRIWSYGWHQCSYSAHVDTVLYFWKENSLRNPKMVSYEVGQLECRSGGGRVSDCKRFKARTGLRCTILYSYRVVSIQYEAL
jgi:hypothetical protein